MVCAQLLDNKDGDVSGETADVRLPLEVANAELSSREKKMKELEESISQSKEQYAQVWQFMAAIVKFISALSLSLSLSLFFFLSLSHTDSWNQNVKLCVA